MAGSTRGSDVKSRLGKRAFSGGKPKGRKIQDARDVLRKKVTEKGRLRQKTTANTKARIQRLMPLKDLLAAKKTVPKKDTRTLEITRSSIRVSTKRRELCRKSIASSHSLKVVTPAKAVSDKTVSMPKRTLTNDLYTKGARSTVLRTVVEEDLRTSSPNLSLTRTTEERPILRKAAVQTAAGNYDNKNLTKIVVTNLHPRVVQEDIAELFSAVGPLLSVKLENCVADVVFAKAVHADIAYQKYHNRMLDGQAMKCTLGLANTPTPVKTSKDENRIGYTGAELVYPSAPSRPVVFKVKI